MGYTKTYNNSYRIHTKHTEYTEIIQKYTEYIQNYTENIQNTGIIQTEIHTIYKEYTQNTQKYVKIHPPLSTLINSSFGTRIRHRFLHVKNTQIIQNHTKHTKYTELYRKYTELYRNYTEIYKKHTKHTEIYRNYTEKNTEKKFSMKKNNEKKRWKKNPYKKIQKSKRYIYVYTYELKTMKNS